MIPLLVSHYMKMFLIWVCSYTSLWIYFFYCVCVKMKLEIVCWCDHQRVILRLMWHGWRRLRLITVTIWKLRWGGTTGQRKPLEEEDSSMEPRNYSYQITLTHRVLTLLRENALFTLSKIILSWRMLALRITIVVLNINLLLELFCQIVWQCEWCIFYCVISVHDDEHCYWLFSRDYVLKGIANVRCHTIRMTWWYSAMSAKIGKWVIPDSILSMFLIIWYFIKFNNVKKINSCFKTMALEAEYKIRLSRSSAILLGNRIDKRVSCSMWAFLEAHVFCLN